MSAHRSSLRQRVNAQRGLMSSHVELLPRSDAPREQEACDSDDVSLPTFDEADAIGGIVPVPPSIALEIRELLSEKMLVQFRGDVHRLDEWLRADHPELGGASPFEALIDGDGISVLLALLRTENRWDSDR